MRRLLPPLVAALATLVPAATPAADPDRGRELYEIACTACHGRSVHARSPRSVRSCAELRATVVRFAGLQRRTWDANDVDDVVLWLNLRYYGFPMEETRCLLDVAAAHRSVVLYSASPTLATSWTTHHATPPSCSPTSPAAPASTRPRATPSR
jgi:hypothetical protein